jgi:hypothetical protein
MSCAYTLKGVDYVQQDALGVVIALLLAKRDELIVRPYEGGHVSPEMSMALGILKKAALDISSIAARLNTSAGIVNAVSELATATDLATCALAGTHGTGEGPRG